MLFRSGGPGVMGLVMEEEREETERGRSRREESVRRLRALCDPFTMKSLNTRLWTLHHLHHVRHFNVDFKCSYTLDYVATLFRSPIYALHGLAVRTIQCKVV